MANETEILLTSQAHAKRVLDESAERAESLLADADRPAAELLMKQRQLAARLLFRQHELALAARNQAVAETDVMSATQARTHMTRHYRTAEALFADQERVASELAEAERALAERVNDEVIGGACVVLMDSHREAAAILLEARLRVEQAGRG